MKMIDTKELKKMQKIVAIKVNPETDRKQHYIKAADELVNPMECPRCVDEVYSLGISMQHYIGSIYLQLITMNKGPKSLYTHLTLKQLGIKEEIQELANHNLDRLLMYFYNNGGPIIEPLVSEESAREIQPRFDGIVADFIKQVDSAIGKIIRSNVNPGRLDYEINDYAVGMYSAMEKMYKVDEMKKAFKELSDMRKR